MRGGFIICESAENSSDRHVENITISKEEERQL